MFRDNKERKKAGKLTILAVLLFLVVGFDYYPEAKGWLALSALIFVTVTGISNFNSGADNISDGIDIGLGDISQ